MLALNSKADNHLVVSRADLEAHAAIASLGSASDRHPTLEQLLVSGTPEAALLATMVRRTSEGFQICDAVLRELMVGLTDSLQRIKSPIQYFRLPSRPLVLKSWQQRRSRLRR